MSRQTKKILKQASSILAALIFMGISAYTAKKQKQSQPQEVPALQEQHEQKETSESVVKANASQNQTDSRKQSVKTDTSQKSTDITGKQTQQAQSAALPAPQTSNAASVSQKAQTQQDGASHRPAIQEAPVGWTTIPPPDFKPSFKWHRSNLERHWDKHQAEFPELHNEQEYAAAALYFFECPPRGTLTKTNGDGDRLFYHQESNTFGAMTSDGTAKTMFRPSAGINYWRRQ